MKKILSMVLALSLLLGIMTFPSTAATIEAVDFDESALADQGLTYTEFTINNAKILGRTSTETPFKFSYPNTGVEFEFTGTTLGVVVTAEPKWNKASYFCVIDGETVVEFKVQSGTNTYILAENLADKEHTAKIMRSQELYDNAMTFGGVITDAGTTITKTADRPLKIQFIGDSITAGFNLSNGTKVYSYQTAELLNADMQSVASAGAHMYDILLDDSANSLTRIRFSAFAENTYFAPYFYSSIQPTYAVKGKFTVNEEDYTFTYAQGGSKFNYQPTNDYDYNSFIPDIIVINLGTNDINQMNQTRASKYWDDNKKGFVQTYVNFLTMLGEHYPNAKIVCSYGMMTEKQDMFNFIQQAVDTYNALPEHAEAVTFKFSYRTDTTGVTLESGQPDTHPGVESHVTAANELSAFIKETFAIGTQTYTADENGKVTLPENVERNNALFKGWYKEDGTAFDINSTLSANEEITLTPVFIPTNDGLNGYIDEEGNDNDPQPVKTTDKYENGLFVQGAQVRTPLDATNQGSLGLRFISVVNHDVVTLLEDANDITNVRFGTLLASFDRVGAVKLEEGMTGVTVSEAKKIWKSVQTLGKNYEKYTACVTNIDEEHISSVIVVRPFISYIDANGVQRYLYGKQYSSNLLDVANDAYKNGDELEEVKNYLFENIISKAEGDNDLGDLEF